MNNFGEIFSNNKRVLSLEFFPPKKDSDLARTYESIRTLSKLQPSFMTVTYGAGGGTREYTRTITSYIVKEIQLPAVAHLTCVGHSVSEIDAILDGYAERGIKCVVALRGDPPKNAKSFDTHPEGFSCARDLVAHIKERGDLSIAVAGYPETHPEAESSASDITYLKEKVDAGADLIITQLFFDVNCYQEFVERARKANISVPIQPGVMPISNVKQLKRFTSMCGATLPDSLLSELKVIESDPIAVEEFGVRYALKTCIQLLEMGAPGIHLYTLNKSDQVVRIMSEL